MTGSIGAEVLVRALGTIVVAARQSGGRVVVIDAIDDGATALYEHHDFAPVPGHEQRLVMKPSTAARALGVAWP